MNAMMKMSPFTRERPIYRVIRRKVKGVSKMLYL